MSLGELYLTQRGISLDTAQKYGIEFDSRVSSKMAIERLGRGWPRHEVNEFLWFPLYHSSGKLISRIARPLPDNALLPKFVCATGRTDRLTFQKRPGKPAKEPTTPSLSARDLLKRWCFVRQAFPVSASTGSGWVSRKMAMVCFVFGQSYSRG
jgi:hypothetical protein